MPVDHVDDVEGGFSRELDDQGVVVLAARRVAVVDLDLGEFLEFGDALLHEADAVGPTVEVEVFHRRRRGRRPRDRQSQGGRSQCGIAKEFPTTQSELFHGQPSIVAQGELALPVARAIRHRGQNQTITSNQKPCAGPLRSLECSYEEIGGCVTVAGSQDGSRRPWRRRRHRFAIPTLRRSKNPQTISTMVLRVC